jgi:hypothetical protein
VANIGAPVYCINLKERMLEAEKQFFYNKFLYTCGQQLNRIPASIQALLINVKDSAI